MKTKTCPFEFTATPGTSPKFMPAGSLRKSALEIERNVGNALLRDRRRGYEQEQCKYRRFHCVLRAADAIAEQANGIDCGRIREEPHMTGDRSFRILLALGLLSAAVAVSCTSPSSTTTSAPAAQRPRSPRKRAARKRPALHEVVPDWPQAAGRRPPTA